MSLDMTEDKCAGHVPSLHGARAGTIRNRRTNAPKHTLHMIICRYLVFEGLMIGKVSDMGKDEASN